MSDRVSPCELRKMRALTLAWTYIVADLKRRQYEEIAICGPAKYVERRTSDNCGVFWDDIQDIPKSPVIRLDKWYKIVSKLAQKSASNGSDEQDEACIYSEHGQRAAEVMIEKTKKSCLDITAIKTVIIGEDMVIDMEDPSYHLAKIPLVKLLNMFTSATIFVTHGEVYVENDDYIEPYDFSEPDED